MALLDQSEKLNSYLVKWREENRRGVKPVALLNQIANLLDSEATAYAQLDPDPFDDRHPAHSDPDCIIGHLWKILFDDEDFMNKIITSYIFNGENNFDLNCVAARILINASPALNGPDLFQDIEAQVGRLIKWAKEAKEPLRSYSCGLLCNAMQLPECPGIFKDDNASLYPICVKRLKILAEISDLNAPCVEDFDAIDTRLTTIKYPTNKPSRRKSEKMELINGSKTPGSASRKRKLNQYTLKQKQYEYRKQDMSLSPLNICMQQILILKYLHPMGEYQEHLAVAFEENVLDLIFHYINPKVQPDAGLACTAILWLSSLLCHKKFIVEFIQRGGIQKLLDIPQPSVVATMSSLCPYYMAYNEDAIERVCLLPQATLQQLTEYLLWLLECAHISGRFHSSLFFSMAFSFRSILNLFDQMDGLRKVFNMISTLKILRVEESNLSTDDEVFMDREMAKNACLTLKKYFEAHITIIAQEYRRINARQSGLTIPSPQLPYRPVLLTSETIRESIDSIQKLVGDRKYGLYKTCTFEKLLRKRVISLNVAPLLLQVVALAADWKNYNYRGDVMVTALEALAAISASRKIAVTFCQNIDVSPTESQSGIQVLLRAAEGCLVNDIQVQKAALNVICNCVTSYSSTKLESEHNLSASVIFSKERLKENQCLQKIWSSVRLHNGIKILLSLLNIKTPITEADTIRAIVCKALCGLSDHDLIRQVFGKLPIFHNEQLQMMMREPVLSDKMSEHVKFCKYAATLIEKVTGKPLRHDNGESITMLAKISKADIIAQTKISYPQKELLMVIYNHLKSQGLEKAAETLQKEAKLPDEVIKPLKDIPVTPYALLRESASYSQPSKLSASDHTASPREPTTPFQNRKTAFSLSMSSPFTSPQLEKRLTPKPRRSISFAHTPGLSSSSLKEKFILPTRIRKQPTPPTLDGIVTGYLREQHARCSNPVTTCPPFSLLRAHHCPEPRYRNYASGNITKRLYTRQFAPKHGGQNGSKHNRRFIHSNFRYTGCVKYADEDSIFTCCAWLPDGENICLGTHAGDIRIYNTDKQEIALHSCHGAPISTVSISKNSKIMTTSASYGAPMGAVWGINRDSDQSISFDLKFELPEDNLIQFSTSEERVVGTENSRAHVYDLHTGSLIRTFYEQRNANNYLKNFACFGPGDDLLLNDGCLWDVRAKNMIHKFDKFNDYVSGVFHPSGLEVIINSEVWDIRTFHLLDTSPALDQCRIVFSSHGDVIYGVKHNSKADMVVEYSGMLGPFETSFRTFDATDYSPITTFDVKKTIFDLCPNPNDQVLAVIESAGNMSTLDLDATCRMYDIGRIKRIGEEESDEETQEDKTDEQESDDQNIEQLLNDFFANEYSPTNEFEENDNMPDTDTSEPELTLSSPSDDDGDDADANDDNMWTDDDEDNLLDHIRGILDQG